VPSGAYKAKTDDLEGPAAVLFSMNLLQLALVCEAMFVDPACGICAGIGKNSNAWQLARPRFQRAKFLQVYEQLDPTCYLTIEDMEMIRELTELRSRLHGSSLFQ